MSSCAYFGEGSRNRNGADGTAPRDPNPEPAPRQTPHPIPRNESRAHRAAPSVVDQGQAAGASKG